MKIQDIKSKTHPSTPPRGTLFHGTSEYVLGEIESGRNRIQRVYKHNNVSLGGAYLTYFWSVANVAAKTAAREHRSKPIVLAVKITSDLFPDEDWVVAAAERPKPSDFDFASETYRNHQYQGFFEDLFSEYLGEGHSLSDEYVRRYDELNDLYGITWRDSFRYKGSVRQANPITAEQITSVWTAI